MSRYAQAVNSSRRLLNSSPILISQSLTIVEGILSPISSARISAKKRRYQITHATTAKKSIISSAKTFSATYQITSSSNSTVTTLLKSNYTTQSHFRNEAWSYQLPLALLLLRSITRGGKVHLYMIRMEWQCTLETRLERVIITQLREVWTSRWWMEVPESGMSLMMLGSSQGNSVLLRDDWRRYCFWREVVLLRCKSLEESGKWSGHEGGLFII